MARVGLKVLVFEQAADVLEKRLGFRVEEYGLRRVFKRAPGHPGRPDSEPSPAARDSPQVNPAATAAVFRKSLRVKPLSRDTPNSSRSGQHRHLAGGGAFRGASSIHTVIAPFSLFAQA